MKKNFERPIMNVELFAPNQAVSTCDAQGGIDYNFDCMYGPEVDTRNVISSMIEGVTASCTTSIGYASGVNTAVDMSSKRNHSNNNPGRATWSLKNGYVSVTYSGAEGLLYTDNASKTNDEDVWSVKNGVLEHSSARGGTHHMVAPVVDSRSINASW